MITISKNKIFNINDANKIFERLESFYDKEYVRKWQIKVVSDINELFKKYEVTNFSVNKNSYMGIVIDCKSKIYNNIFIKVVPPMIGRFKTEVETLMKLPSNLTCKIYEVDMDKNAIVMEKILPGQLALFYEKKNLFKQLFVELDKNKIEIDDSIDNNFLSFLQVVEHDYEICNKTNHSSPIVECLYNEFKKSYSKITKNQKSYLLHGDVYQNNAILSNFGIKIIDPLGFKAPFVMELLPICAYEMLNNQKNNSEILDDFINFFSPFVERDYYKEALFCQLVKVYIPSIYEANDGGVRSNKWLAIIKELYPEKLINK